MMATKASSGNAQTFWHGQAPVKCQMRGEAILTKFVDGSTGSGGPWAIMCDECHKTFGVGLGIGRGQRFVMQGDGRFLKTEG